MWPRPPNVLITSFIYSRSTQSSTLRYGRCSFFLIYLDFISRFLSRLIVVRPTPNCLISASDALYLRNPSFYVSDAMYLLHNECRRDGWFAHPWHVWSSLINLLHIFKHWLVFSRYKQYFSATSTWRKPLCLGIYSYYSKFTAE